MNFLLSVNKIIRASYLGKNLIEQTIRWVFSLILQMQLQLQCEEIKLVKILQEPKSWIISIEKNRGQREKAWAKMYRIPFLIFSTQAIPILLTPIRYTKHEAHSIAKICFHLLSALFYFISLCT